MKIEISSGLLLLVVLFGCFDSGSAFWPWIRWHRIRNNWVRHQLTDFVAKSYNTYNTNSNNYLHTQVFRYTWSTDPATRITVYYVQARFKQTTCDKKKLNYLNIPTHLASRKCYNHRVWLDQYRKSGRKTPFFGCYFQVIARRYRRKIEFLGFHIVRRGNRQCYAQHLKRRKLFFFLY
jgi:hypothetical protein